MAIFCHFFNFMMLSFWNETLKNLSQDQRKDIFVFIVNKIRFEVPLSYALGISPLITDQLLKDPSFKELEITDNEKIENEFSDFIRGKEIRNETFFKYGHLLKNREMLKKWKESEELTNKTVFQYLKGIFDIYKNDNKDNSGEMREIIDFEDIKEEIQYIGKHFSEMKEEIMKFPAKDLIYILKNEELTIESEDIIWEIVKEKLKEIKSNFDNKNLQKLRWLLLENIKIKYLNMNNFKEYIEEIQPEDFSYSSNSSTNEKKRRRKYMETNSRDYFE